MLQPPPASLTWSNPLNNNPLHVFNRLIEKYLIAQRRACHRLHLTGDLKALIDEKSALIAGWVKSGKLAPIDPQHLIFMIWASPQ